MANTKLLKNSSFSVLQTIVTAITALVIFKLMALELGLAITGVWSYLASVIAITSFGSFGFANALLYYIPKYYTLHQYDRISNLINTTLYSIIGLTFILCFIAYLIFHFTIPFTVDDTLIPVANRLLPIVIFAFFFSGISSTYLSVLDGMMLMHLRAKITIAGSILFLILAFFFIKIFGIIGVPLAQAIQNVFMLAVSYILVKKNQHYYRFSITFDKQVFREIFRYGFKFQLISITQILADPFIKSMITKFAGTANTAIFDIIVKMLGAVRGLLISANQIIVPQVTVFNTLNNNSRLVTFYKTNFKIILLVGIILFFTPLAFSELFLTFLFNSTDFNSAFVLFNVSIALFVNALAFPAHFQYLGIGKLKWLVINNSITALLMLIAAPLLGYFAEGIYVVMAWSVPTVIGPIILMYAFSKEHKISTLQMIDKKAILFILAFVIVIVINYNLREWKGFNESRLAMYGAQALIYTSLLAYPILSNITLKKIIARIRYRYAK